MSADTYDFGPLHRKLLNVHSKEPIKALRDIFPYVMDIKAIRNFMADYLEGNFYTDMSERLQHRMDAKGRLKFIYDSYRSTEDAAQIIEGRPKEHVEKPRPVNEFPLSADEIKIALSVLSNCPALTQTVAIIQGGLAGYLHGFIDYIDDLEDAAGLVNQHFRKHVVDILINADSFSMVHDLATGIAYSMARDGWKKEDGLQGRHITRGIATSIQASFFQSTRGCPFKSLVGHVFNTSIRTADDGHIQVLDGVLEPGALPIFIASHLQTLSNPKYVRKMGAPEHLFSI